MTLFFASVIICYPDMAKSIFCLVLQWRRSQHCEVKKEGKIVKDFSIRKEKNFFFLCCFVRLHETCQKRRTFCCKIRKFWDVRLVFAIADAQVEDFLGIKEATKTTTSVKRLKGFISAVQRSEKQANYNNFKFKSKMYIPWVFKRQ